jgi:hypothetical protein
MFSHYDEFSEQETHKRRLACLLEMLDGDDPLILEAAQLIEMGLVSRTHPSVRGLKLKTA